MKLEDRIAKAIGKHGPVSKKMFGGTCFMINGNMAMGIFKDGMLARVGKEARHALNLPGAEPFEMRGRVMDGYVIVAEAALASDEALAICIDLCLKFNQTLPSKTMKKVKNAKHRQPE
jgi:TfoX/Sxy family transcriptional regulator of competence genes